MDTQSLQSRGRCTNISREIDFDWGVSFNLLSFVDNIWGPHTVDRVADDYNAKIRNLNKKMCIP